MNDLGKIPPCDLKIEMAILGQFLLDKSKLELFIDSMSPVYFYSDAHRTILEAVKNVLQQKVNVDMLTVLNELKTTNKLEEIGGAFYLTQLVSNVVSSKNIEFHIQILKQKWLQREAIEQCSNIIEACYNSEFSEINKGFENIQTEINNYFAGGLTSKSLAEHAEMSIKNALERKKQGGQITGIETGVKMLNDYNSGWQPGDMIIIAARPSMGKTAISLHYAFEASKDKKVIYFSLEMSAEKLTDRILTAKTNLNPGHYKSGTFENEFIEPLWQTAEMFKTKNLEIIDSIFELDKIKSIVKSKKAKKECDIVFIDYLGLVQPTNRYKGNKVNETGEVSREIKQLAQQTKVPVIALHQLNRDVEKRPGNIPQLSDLRDSGSLEQDADTVIFLFREDYYNKLNPDYENKFEITNIISKNRDGSTGAFTLKHNKYINQFFEEGGEFEQTGEMPF